MYSVTCNDITYETSMVMREINRIEHFMQYQAEAEGLTPDDQTLLGESLAWCVFRLKTLLNKKLIFFFLVFVMEKMIQLHLKITYMAVQKHHGNIGISAEEDTSWLLCSSTLVSMFMSVFTLAAFLNIAVSSRRQRAVLVRTIEHYEISTNGEYYVAYIGAKVNLDKMLRHLSRLVAAMVLCSGVGLGLLVWAAVKLTMVFVCHDGLWNFPFSWDLHAGCVTFNN